MVVKRPFESLETDETDLFTYLGTVHFLGGGGAGEIWGGHVKKMALKGGPSKKNKGKGGGHVKYFCNT